MYAEMPHFRQFPEIRKFCIELERKNFGKNETGSLDKKRIDLKGGTVRRRKMYQNLLIRNQTGNLFHALVLSQVF